MSLVQKYETLAQQTERAYLGALSAHIHSHRSRRWSSAVVAFSGAIPAQCPLRVRWVVSVAPTKYATVTMYFAPH